MLDYANHFLFLAKFEILFYNSNSHTCHSSLGGQTLPFKVYFSLFKISPSDNSSPPLFCNFLYSFTSNEPKNSWIYLTSTMVRQNFEKPLLKLLGINPLFLTVPPPFQIKFFNPPFQCIFKFLNGPLKRGDEIIELFDNHENLTFLSITIILKRIT